MDVISCWKTSKQDSMDQVYCGDNCNNCNIFNCVPTMWQLFIITSPSQAHPREVDPREWPQEVTSEPRVFTASWPPARTVQHSSSSVALSWRDLVKWSCPHEHHLIHLSCSDEIIFGLLDCLTQKWNCVNLQIRTRLGINVFDSNFDNNSWSDAELRTEQRFSPFPTHDTKYLLSDLS